MELKRNEEHDRPLALSAQRPLSTILPTIEPEIDQFEKRQAVTQCDAQAVYENREITDVEVC